MLARQSILKLRALSEVASITAIKVATSTKWSIHQQNKWNHLENLLHDLKTGKNLEFQTTWNFQLESQNFKGFFAAICTGSSICVLSLIVKASFVVNENPIVFFSHFTGCWVNISEFRLEHVTWDRLCRQLRNDSHLTRAWKQEIISKAAAI